MSTKRLKYLNYNSQKDSNNSTATLMINWTENTQNGYYSGNSTINLMKLLASEQEGDLNRPARQKVDYFNYACNQYQNHGKSQKMVEMG